MYKKGHQCQIPGLLELYMEEFGYTRYGSFVEIGAFNGYNWSNTWPLAEAGWRGLMVEPNPEFFEQCVETHLDHDGVVVVQCCIGSHSAKDVKLYLGGSISTIVPKRVDIYSEIEWSSHIGMSTDNFILCNMKTLDELLDEASWPQGFELLVIDVEGAEPDVMAGFDLGYWHPSMVIIELNETAPDERLSANAAPIGELFAGHGYEKVYADHINTIFLREGHADKR